MLYFSAISDEEKPFTVGERSSRNEIRSNISVGSTNEAYLAEETRERGSECRYSSSIAPPSICRRVVLDFASASRRQSHLRHPGRASPGKWSKQ